MITPQYQFNLGSDPLLNTASITPEAYINNIDQEIQRLNIAKQQLTNSYNRQPVEDIWSTIDKEISSLDDNQKQILAQDKTYSSIESELQFLIQQELINSVKDKVANSSRGKELLEKQLNNIRDKKAAIQEQSNKEVELFKKFQVAVQANPNLTYPEFIKSLK